MKLINFWKTKIWKAYVILPAITLFCFAGFIASLLFPNTVLDTYVINMDEEEGDTQELVPLSLGADHAVYYYCDTNGRSMQGIQVGIDKQGEAFLDTVLVYTVSMQKDRTLLSENRYAIRDGQDVQYVYLPYANADACKGKIRVDFYLEGEAMDGGKAPALIVNHKQVKDTLFFDGAVSEQEREKEPNLKCSHIYSHETYPFLYDFRIMSFVFLAVSMAVSYPALTKKESVKGNKKEKTKEGGSEHGKK